MKVYGLTGGIGSGKSTVANLLRKLGAGVVDADELAREVVRPGTPALAEIVAAFGDGVLLPDGALDRKRLGVRVFSDEAARHRLNAITHPRIAEESARRLAALAAGGAPFAFYEAALLVESGADRFAGLVVVEADPARQRERVVRRDGVDAAEADRRIQAQATPARRRAAADVVLLNDGDLAALEAQVRVLYDRLTAGGPLRLPG